ncbi:SCP2 sterol-binding domain-containing protein [Haliangium ochraceum]|uniref:Sterol-binding domain protein n=1 Tax=Haliangium ochraceum (strain DSM 14365 / JCM 11303 / SMP-2) TaxID=502025 RepID=D0LQD3_HALO1|nr:SCP2 sterol-binding domain-containing protein [Haliangium ochraceum]ACY18942.1 Sterol-binding domain protein [Haliangium ochraceum DSM 14365]
MSSSPPSAQELFNERMPKALESHPDRARQVNAIYSFDISGEGGGQWTVDLTKDTPTVEKGLPGTAQCTIAMDHADFQEMLKDPQVGMQLYFQGKLTVAGDPALAAKLQEFFQLV